MYEIKAVVRPNLVEGVIQALQAITDMPSVTVSTVRAHGRRRRAGTSEGVFDDVVIAKLEAVVPDGLLQSVLDAIRRNAHTGRDGDGRIFVSDVRQSVNIRGDD